MSLCIDWSPLSTVSSIPTLQTTRQVKSASQQLIELNPIQPLIYWQALTPWHLLFLPQIRTSVITSPIHKVSLNIRRNMGLAMALLSNWSTSIVLCKCLLLFTCCCLFCCWWWFASQKEQTKKKKSIWNKRTVLNENIRKKPNGIDLWEPFEGDISL